MIPPLADVIQRYDGKLHLMAEIKPHSVATKRLNEVLSELFSPLQPAIDFHLLPLHPQLFSAISFNAPETMIPIAETNAGAVSGSKSRYHLAFLGPRHGNPEADAGSPQIRPTAVVW